MAAAALRNQERFNHTRTLVLTGERAEESAARACSAPFEPDRSDRRQSAQLGRHVDHLRLVHGWSEQDVWDIMRRWRVNPHPAYRLGWGRVSCAACIFGSNHQWASLRQVNPAQFAQVARYEADFGCTIRRDRTTVAVAADQGRPYPSITVARSAEALDNHWNRSVILPAGEVWHLPAGAFGDKAGPM